MATAAERKSITVTYAEKPGVVIGGVTSASSDFVPNRGLQTEGQAAWERASQTVQYGGPVSLFPTSPAPSSPSTPSEDSGTDAFSRIPFAPEYQEGAPKDVTEPLSESEVREIFEAQLAIERARGLTILSETEPTATYIPPQPQGLNLDLSNLFGGGTGRPLYGEGGSIVDTSGQQSGIRVTSTMIYLGMALVGLVMLKK